MKSIEVCGKTIDEAIEKGLKELNCDREEIEIEIIDAPSKGIFGIFGAKDAKIKLTYISAENKLSSFSLDESSFDLKDEIKDNPENNTDDMRNIKNNHSEPVMRPNNDHHQNNDQNGDESPETAAICFLENIFDKLGIEVQTDVSKKDDFINLSFQGNNLGILIGRRGETLDSLQYLTNLVVGKKFGQRFRIILDVEGYRERREQTLINLALRLSEKVKKTGHNIVLEPMNPHERRIIHTALQNDTKVRTFSEGEEPHRKVVITKKSKS